MLHGERGLKEILDKKQRPRYPPPLTPQVPTTSQGGGHTHPLTTIPNRGWPRKQGLVGGQKLPIVHLEGN